MTEENFFSDLIESLVEKEKSAVKEMKRLYDKKQKSENKEEKKRVDNQIGSIKEYLNKSNSLIPKIVDRAFQFDPETGKPIKEKRDELKKKIEKVSKEEIDEGSGSEVERSIVMKGEEEDKGKKKEENKGKTIWDILSGKSELEREITELERLTIKRLLKAEEKEEEKRKEKEAKKAEDEKSYLKTASKVFSKSSKNMVDNGMFSDLGDDLIKANMNYTAHGYLSIILFNTLIALIVAVVFTGFFLFFNVSTNPPFITNVGEPLFSRLPKVAWMPIVFPLVVFFFSYFYPRLERKSVANQIDSELPFATINMSAISGSMIDPSQIFKIIIATGEYPALQKEFTKLMNQINIYGYDFVSALRNSAENTPSEKLAELYGGLANTITSGGDLSAFFDKRSENLLFEHKMQREKSTKTAETFMDIYISVVIAAPMVLMLILIMMKISGLGLSLSTQMITIIMVLGVGAINIGFLVFLHLKQKGGK